MNDQAEDDQPEQWSPKITQDQFEAAYAARSGISLADFRETFIGLPCGCDCEECEGWAAVMRDPDAIAEHLDFYAPFAPRTMTVNRFGGKGGILPTTSA